jgi:hypothetical protein
MKRVRLIQRFARRLTAVASVCAIGLGASLAHADPRAPQYMQDTYHLPCTPSCTLCHATTLGGINNWRPAVKPDGTSVPGGFILALKTCGFQPLDMNTWQPALNKCETDGVDSDGDKVPDIKELEAGTDPNDGTDVNAQICGGGPTYGCVRVARGNSIDGFALVASSVALLVGIALVRRRHARGR